MKEYKGLPIVEEEDYCYVSPLCPERRDTRIDEDELPERCYVRYIKHGGSNMGSRGIASLTLHVNGEPDYSDHMVGRYSTYEKDGEMYKGTTEENDIYQMIIDL